MSFFKDIIWSFVVLFFIYIMPFSINTISAQDTQATTTETSNIIEGLILIAIVGYALIIGLAFVHFRKAKLQNIATVSILNVIFIFSTLSPEFHEAYIVKLFPLAPLEAFLWGGIGTIFFIIPIFISGSIVMYLIKRKN